MYFWMRVCVCSWGKPTPWPFYSDSIHRVTSALLVMSSSSLLCDSRLTALKIQVSFLTESGSGLGESPPTQTQRAASFSIHVCLSSGAAIQGNIICKWKKGRTSMHLFLVSFGPCKKHTQDCMIGTARLQTKTAPVCEIAVSQRFRCTQWCNPDVCRSSTILLSGFICGYFWIHWLHEPWALAMF